MSAKPRHGDYGICVVCGDDMEYIEYTGCTGTETEVLDEGWSHTVHPLDGHEAQLNLPRKHENDS